MISAVRAAVGHVHGDTSRGRTAACGRKRVRKGLGGAVLQIEGTAAAAGPRRASNVAVKVAYRSGPRGIAVATVADGDLGRTARSNTDIAGVRLRRIEG